MDQPSRAYRDHPEDGHARPAPPAKPRKPSGPVPVEVVDTVPRAAAAGAPPWWYAAPSVAAQAVEVALAPLRVLVLVCEVVVSLAFTGAVGLAAAWYFKFIPDAQVGQLVAALSERLQGILHGAGLM